MVPSIFSTVLPDLVYYSQTNTYCFSFFSFRGLRMEPPHIFLGGAEECHSSESGWTMYIGSPIDHEEGNCDDEDNLGCCYDQGTTQADPEVESDDSMASDASSGPSHYGVNPLTHLQQQKVVEEEHDEDVCYSDRKKASKKKEKQVAEKKGEKKQMVFRNSKGKEDPAQGSGKVKVRKSHWVGTRK